MSPRGTFVAVVGPSGVGKDTLMRTAAARRPDLVLARRVVAPPREDFGEEAEGVSEAEFARRRDAGAFALHWAAHGRLYAIPADVDAVLAEGRHVLANLSRAAIPEARARFDLFRAVALTAPPEALAARLARRGRETAEEIVGRLARSASEPPVEGDDVRTVENGGPLDDALAGFLAALPEPLGPAFR